MKKENERFRNYIKKMVNLTIIIQFILQGIKIDIHSEDLIFLTGVPNDSIKNLSFYLKSENKDNKLACKSKSLLINSILNFILIQILQIPYLLNLSKMIIQV